MCPGGLFHTENIIYNFGRINSPFAITDGNRRCKGAFFLVLYYLKKLANTSPMTRKIDNIHGKMLLRYHTV